jgi:hypothetical protein
MVVVKDQEGMRPHTIVQVASMISMGRGDEGLRCIRRPISELVVQCTLQVAQNMLDSLPVRESRIGVKSGKNSGSIGNVWPGGECQGHERANNGDVGVLAHFCNFCAVL